MLGFIKMISRRVIYLKRGEFIDILEIIVLYQGLVSYNFRQLSRNIYRFIGLSLTIDRTSIHRPQVGVQNQRTIWDKRSMLAYHCHKQIFSSESLTIPHWCIKIPIYFQVVAELITSTPRMLLLLVYIAKIIKNNEASIENQALIYEN